MKVSELRDFLHKCDGNAEELLMDTSFLKNPQAVMKLFSIENATITAYDSEAQAVALKFCGVHNIENTEDYRIFTHDLL